MVRYDGRGYGYFSLIKPDSKDKEDSCACGDYPASLCDCDEVNDYENQGWDDNDND